jgi:hypothetical protein
MVKNWGNALSRNAIVFSLFASVYDLRITTCSYEPHYWRSSLRIQSSLQMAFSELLNKLHS